MSLAHRNGPHRNRPHHNERTEADSMPTPPHYESYER